MRCSRVSIKDMNLFEQSLGAESALQENGGIPENNGLVLRSGVPVPQSVSSQGRGEGLIQKTGEV